MRRDYKKSHRGPRSLKSAGRRKRVYQLVIDKSADENSENSLRLAGLLSGRLKKAGYDCYQSIAEDHDEFASMATAAARRRPFAVIVFGDDISVRIAAARVVRAKGLLGIVPCGQSNNIYTSLYGNDDAEAALNIVRSDYQKRIDAGLANGHFFLGSLVSGLVPAITSRLSGKKPPRLALSWSKLAANAADDSVVRTTKMKVDSFTFSAKPLVLNIHLLPSLLDLRFAPAAVADDGHLILIYDREGNREMISHYIRDLKKNKYQYTDGIQMIRGERITISPVAGRSWLIDGEDIEFSGDEVIIEVLHRAVRIFSDAPKK